MEKNSKAVIICKQCGAKFSCGADATTEQCWCHDLPNVLPLTDETKSFEDCYCSKCLEEIISKKINLNVTEKAENLNLKTYSTIRKS